MLQATNIHKNFGKVTALDGVDLTLNEGEILGFIGPNGAGKTTMMRIIMGVLQADQGETKVFGLDSWQNAVEIHQKVAYVPGDVNLWPNLTGGEVIDLFLRLKDAHQKNQKQQLIEQFELDPTKKCRTYSKGNRQKVALVAAFASDADLYVLDEPTSGLDPLMEKVFQAKVLKLAEAGKSVLLSSHILSEVEKLCNKVSIIREGKIIETGTLSEMKHLTRMQVIVKTQKKLKGLHESPYIHDYRETSKGTSFSINSEYIGDIVAYLTPFGITDLQCLPPTLEELFMSHYSERGQSE
jgi:ABC-2 type transport system ATP-binding protein